MARAGSTRAWRRVREHVLARDNHTCQLKLPGCTYEAGLRGGHVHHLVGRHTGLDPQWLVASCQSCNLTTGDPTRSDPAPIGMTDWTATP